MLSVSTVAEPGPTSRIFMMRLLCAMLALATTFLNVAGPGFAAAAPLPLVSAVDG